MTNHSCLCGVNRAQLFLLLFLFLLFLLSPSKQAMKQARKRHNMNKPKVIADRLPFAKGFINAIEKAT